MADIAVYTPNGNIVFATTEEIGLWHDTLTTIANFIIDDELVDGKHHEMTIDDAFESVHTAVTMARETLGLPREMEH